MFGSTKTPKSQKPEKKPLYFHRLHDRDSNPNLWKDHPYRQITTIDIGYENLCLRIARRYISPKKVECYAYEKASVKVETDQDGYNILFRQLEQLFDQHRDELNDSHIVLIEWQLPQNYKAVRISTFLVAYFIFLLKNNKNRSYLIEMRSEFKDMYFPELKPLNQNARKTQCEEIGRHLLHLMNDKKSLEVMDSGSSKRKKRKQDDYADTVIMEEVFCRYSEEIGWNFPHYQKSRQIIVKRRNEEKDDIEESMV